MALRTSDEATRMGELRQALETRRRQLTADMNGLLRGVRARAATDRDITDPLDGIDTDAQDDLELALLQMKAETLQRLDAALRRIDAGQYGNCTECGQPISSHRLRALPFAVRCTTCQEKAESDAPRYASGPKLVSAFYGSLGR